MSTDLRGRSNGQCILAMEDGECQGWAFHELFVFFGIRIILYIIRQDGSNTEYLLGNLFYVE